MSKHVSYGAGMGGRIFVVDRHKRNIGRVRASAPARAPAPPRALAALLALALALGRPA